MAKRVTNANIMEMFAHINSRMDGFQSDLTILGSKVAALEKGVTAPSNATGKKAATTKGKGKSKATVDMADFEPVKGADGYYNWSSYKANRTKYCYAVATNGEVTDGKPYGTNWYGKVDFAEDGAYYTAKASYDAKFGYTKKSDRK